MEKQNFTRQEVIQLIDELLQYPDQLIDAVSNEDTNWDGKSLLEMEEEYKKTKV